MKASAPSNRRLDVIAAADIETAEDGTLLDVNLAYEDYYETFTNWDDWLEAAELAVSERGIGRIWFHNGGRFDLVGLVCGLLRGDFEHMVDDFNSTLIGGSIIEVQIRMKESDKLIRLADSFRLMPSSLDDLAGPKGFGYAKGKDDVPEFYKSKMQLYKRDFSDRYHAYHRRDTLLLLQILSTFRELLNDIALIGNLRLTCASTALAVFKTGYLEYDLILPGKQERDFTRLAYQGGRTEFVGMGSPKSGTVATFEGVNKYDVISMYPRMMWLYNFPLKKGSYRTGDHYTRNDRGIILPGCYRARFRQQHGHVPLLKPRMADGSLGKDGIWAGETYATHMELRELESSGGFVEIIDGIIHRHNTMVPLFRTFVDRLYATRLEAERVGNLALKLVVKLIMNNLYGKFGQGETGERMATLTEAQIKELRQRGAKITPMPDFGDDAYSILEEIDCRNAFPAIAAFVTAAARLTLLRVVNDMNIRLLYCDTDSFHTQDRIPEELVSDSELGKFKLESRPGGHTMAYGGRKLYIDLTEEKSRAKGIPKKAHDIAAMHLAFEGRSELTNFYTAPSSIKTAIRKGLKSPNEFRAYSRRIKGEPSSYEKGLLK